MRNFLSTLGETRGIIFTIIVVATSIAAALTAEVTVSHLVGRVEKLESDLGAARAKIAALTASQSKLSTSIDTPIARSDR